MQHDTPALLRPFEKGARESLRGDSYIARRWRRRPNLYEPFRDNDWVTIMGRRRERLLRLHSPPQGMRRTVAAASPRWWSNCAGPNKSAEALGAASLYFGSRLHIRKKAHRRTVGLLCNDQTAERRPAIA
jgi:hypothetical protein